MTADSAVPGYEGLEPIKVVVTETIEYELTLEPTDPNWSWLLDYWHDPDEVVAALDDVASNTDGSVEKAIRASVGPSGSWRDVTHP